MENLSRFCTHSFPTHTDSTELVHKRTRIHTKHTAKSASSSSSVCDRIERKNTKNQYEKKGVQFPLHTPKHTQLKWLLCIHIYMHTSEPNSFFSCCPFTESLLSLEKSLAQGLVIVFAEVVAHQLRFTLELFHRPFLSFLQQLHQTVKPFSSLPFPPVSLIAYELYIRSFVYRNTGDTKATMKEKTDTGAWFLFAFSIIIYLISLFKTFVDFSSSNHWRNARFMPILDHLQFISSPESLCCARRNHYSSFGAATWNLRLLWNSLSMFSFLSHGINRNDGEALRMTSDSVDGSNWCE